MQAFYTSGHSMPTPFTTIHYMNRFINCYKLVDCLYTHLPSGKDMKTFAKAHKLPNKSTINVVGNVRAMEKKDLPTIYKLYNQQVAKYKLFFKYSQDDLMHLLLPKDDIVWTYVIEGDEENGKPVVTDFVSMYRLTQSTTSPEAQSKGINSMNSGGLFFYGLTKNSLEEVGKLVLHMAKENMDCDAFSAMNLMDNTAEIFQEKLGFVPGDGALHYYLVNYSLGTEVVQPNDLGTILL